MQRCVILLYYYKKVFNNSWKSRHIRVSVQGVKSLGGHFACLCRGFEFYEVKKLIVIIFQKENGNTFTLLIIFIGKSLQKEQNSTNLLQLLINPQSAGIQLGCIHNGSSMDHGPCRGNLGNHPNVNQLLGSYFMY